MGSLSNYAEGKLLDHILKTSAFTVPSNIYVTLSTADPGESGSGIAEPSGNNFSRVQVNTWDTAASRATANTGVVQFPTASGNWGALSHFAIFDASTSGNMLAYGALTSGGFTAQSGDAPRIAAGDLDVSFNSGGLATYAANKLLDHMFKVGAYTQPTNLYVGLSTANPGDSAGTLAEPSGNSYARVNVNAWDAVASGATANTSTITFADASGSWGTLTHGAIFDALTTGNMLIYGALGTSKSIISGQAPVFAAGDFDITID